MLVSLITSSHVIFLEEKVQMVEKSGLLRQGLFLRFIFFFLVPVEHPKMSEVWDCLCLVLDEKLLIAASVTTEAKYTV